ncbi:MAG: LamG-like jellyroll fold domain-containing protein, partial [Bacteroidia bacterium]
YPVYMSTNPTGNVLNYNNYYNVAGGNLGYRGSAFNSTSYLSASAGGDTSYNVLPMFLSPADLHITNACLKGFNLTSIVPNDIDGNTRSNPPVIGAHEASGSLNDVALVTTYYNIPIISGAQNLSVKIKNNNIASVTSLNISYRLNGGSAVTIPWTGTMAGCDTMLVTFTGSNQMNLLPGSNSVVVYTSAPNGSPDVNTGNDTAYLEFSTVTKIPGNFISCNGTAGVTGNYVRMASSPLMNATTAFTAEAWIKIPSPSTSQKFFSKSSTTNGFCLGVLNGNFDPEIWTLANGTGSIRVTSSAIWPNNIIQANTWTHIAVTWQSGVGVKAYIDGYQVGAMLSATATTMTPSVNDLFIGMDSWDYGFALTGMVDEVRLWNIALDSTTIRKNMYRTIKVTEPGLISYVQLNEPSGAMRVSDPISGSIGTKGAATVIASSTIPVGGDTCLMIPQMTTGTLFNASLTLSFSDPFDSLCDLVINEYPISPNALPAATHTLSNKYWMIRPFGTPGTFLTNLIFTFPTGQLNVTDTSLGLYRRTFNSDATSWTLAKRSSSISSTNVTFTSVDTLGQFTIASNGTSPLPVSLISFGGKRTGNDVVLNWQTTHEINCRGFEIERSFDAENFVAIGFVKSKAINSSSNIGYSFSDVKPEQTKVLFYRLKQVDLDGRFSFSPIVTINPASQSLPVCIFPNPTNSTFQIEINAVQQMDVSIEIFDLHGSLVSTNVVRINPGTNTVTSNQLENFNPGIYFIKLIMNNEVKEFKLIKAN